MDRLFSEDVDGLGRERGRHHALFVIDVGKDCDTKGLRPDLTFDPRTTLGGQPGASARLGGEGWGGADMRGVGGLFFLFSFFFLSSPLTEGGRSLSSSLFEKNGLFPLFSS